MVREPIEGLCRGTGGLSSARRVCLVRGGSLESLPSTCIRRLCAQLLARWNSLRATGKPSRPRCAVSNSRALPGGSRRSPASPSGSCNEHFRPPPRRRWPGSRSMPSSAPSTSRCSAWGNTRFVGGRKLHSGLAWTSGAIGGAFGLAALAVELPVSTTIILRAIAAIAQKEGEDLADPPGLPASKCFALGDRRPTIAERRRTISRCALCSPGAWSK